MDDDLDATRLLILAGLLAFVVLVSTGASIGALFIARAREILLRVLDVQHRAYRSAHHLEKSTAALVASAPSTAARATSASTAPEDERR